MATRVGLLGFGRIGRNLFRLLYNREDVRIAAISDWNEPEPLEYLLRFDSQLGRFPGVVSIRDGYLYAAGRQIRMITGRDQGQVPWGDLGVHTVLEATSRSRTRAELHAHLDAGARRVIACAPPREAADVTVVPGVSEGKIEARHRIVSNASSTVHCLAPVARILHDAFGVERALFTTVHAYTGQHRLADVPAEDMRLGRAAAENIIPQESRSPAIVMEAIPELAGRVTGSAVAVPVRNGSAVDLVCWHSRDVTRVAVNEVVRTAASTDRWSRILRFESEPIVSSDVARSAWSSTFDSLATMTLGNRVSKTIAWYDSGFGYAHRAVDLIERFAEVDRAAGEAPS
ncbi:MAG TPA: glyceraldehyde 3-phosphate dehydrogenase NAD-binding domain-containing protein [Thermoanaerobaculia bacterium]|nr:glyceraldehyde 3-phosphate dehydrogenase NAD-binding domain-containing protein [Thermoanaerobaculia bacterium]